jgi:recombination protein RecA
MFGEGISRAGDVLDVATSSGIVTRRGTFFYYGEDKLGQGRENAKDYLKSNPEVMEQVASALKTRAESGALPVAASQPQPEDES